MRKGNENRGNRKRKMWLITALILILALVAAVVIFFLMGQNSKEKEQYEAQLKQETQNFTEELIVELDQIDTSNEGAISDASENNTASTTEVPAGVKTEAEKEVIAEELKKLDDEKKQQILQTLSVAYSEALNQQKQEAFKMADDLIAQGKADWAALVKTGENTSANKVKLASEYIAKSKVMEEQMDASFHALTDKMEEQLSAEGIDSTEIIAQYQAEYDKIKSENKSAMMKKVMDALKH